MTENELSNSDILMSFIYFNVSALRLANKPIQVEKEAVNPNLAKVFLRHYAEFAKQNNFDIDSDEEDYVIPVTRHHGEGITLDDLTPNIKPPVVKPPPMRYKKGQAQQDDGGKQTGSVSALAGKKTDIFAADDKTKGIKKSDLNNKFEFPTLGESPAPPVKAVNSASWGRGDLYLYDRPGALTKKDIEEHFPTLGNEPVAKQEKPAPPKVVPKPQVKPDFGKEETPAGAFNWLEESKRLSMQNALNHGNVDIIKAKKKKKK